MSDSLWDNNRVERYVKMYGDPREKKGSQSNLCKDAANLITGKSILDVGCGIGHLIPHIYPEGGVSETKYYGFDYSPGMLAKLREFFPDIYTIQGDATLPYKKFEEELSYHITEPIDTVVSTSLIIHLPILQDVRNLLLNMLYTAKKEIIFSVETMGDGAITRASGLTIRNISVPSMLNYLAELDINRDQVSWMHQQMTYRQQTTVNPLLSNPLAMTPPQLFQRTTLFKVSKTPETTRIKVPRG